ncbi:MAG: hypothetical protein FJ272_17480, partial [Planctomycetes bacterium]|nr:hypothetical protein [Planctomycetota bacterium]
MIPTSVGTRTLHLPHGLSLAYLKPEDGWQVVGTVGQHPAALVRKGAVVFAFDPTALMGRYLNMMDIRLTADILDWMVGCVLLAAGHKARKPMASWRDFHALGIATWMIERLAQELGRPFSAAPIRRLACQALRRGDLTAAFQALGRVRQKLLPVPVHFLDILHGGIMVGREGFGEYDWPQAAADLLDFYLDWNRRFGYRYSHDIGAGTLHQLAPMFPETLARLRAAWNKGEVEFTNGTWSQPYLHLWGEEECRQQFVQGLAAFDALFGRRPTTYAAQEFALHPALPDLLRQFGFERAIHRVQNMGKAPDDDHPLIEWEGVGGATIPTLPSCSVKSEKLGSGIYAAWPRLVAATHRLGLPFVALVNLIDQTFIGAYKEEFVRACRYGDALGRFMTCEEFFAAVASQPRERVRYRMDDYLFDLEMPTNNYHRYESGGFSTTIEHWRGMAEGLRQGGGSSAEWQRVLDGESHDAYVVQHFKTGAFLDLYLTDYAGPRYRVTTDERRGATRFLRDAAGMPREPRAVLPVPMEGDGPVNVDAATGGVLVDGRPFGALLSTRGPSRVLSVTPGPVTRVVVRIERVGDFMLSCWSHKGALYGLVERPDEMPWFRHDVPYWDD